MMKIVKVKIVCAFKCSNNGAAEDKASEEDSFCTDTREEADKMQVFLPAFDDFGLDL